MSENIFKDFNFDLLNSEDFKEDAVREELIHPILKQLGYKASGKNKIIRSKALDHPFVKTGSGKGAIKSIPDYLFEINGKYTWVLDAKNPKEEIKAGKNKQQAYFYAIHPDINVNYYALCNGKEFIVFQINKEEAILYFNLSEIDKYWEEIEKVLSPKAFDIFQENIVRDSGKISKDDSYYLSRGLLKEIPCEKQGARRHYGVHGYFTRQTWNVVQAYILHFTQPNDTVLDPFGGSGVTAIEALVNKRKALHIDINPLSVFWVKNLIKPVSLKKIIDEFEKIKTEFLKKCPNTDEEIEQCLQKYPYPKGNILPKGSDVDTVEKLFTPKQLAHLALLKNLILKIKDKEIKNCLLLSFSSSTNKFNRTFHYTKSQGGGDSGVFRYYRYRVAPEPADLDLIKVFEGKVKRLIEAKKEIEPIINEKTINNAQIIKGSATDLNFIQNESVDYIYTDPPYGSKIQYLDLSTMWNAWLDLEVTEQDRELEAIEGGERHQTEETYKTLLAKSFEEMYRVLKFNRWMSFVFAHSNPKYWHFIVETAERLGFEYAGSVQQANGQTSFKKRQHSYSVLAGQLIINFKKVKTPQSIQKVKLGTNIYPLIIETIESVIAKNDGAKLEEINDELIIKGLELGFLDVLSREYKDLSPLLMENFDYESETEKFHIHKDKKFKTNIPLNLRIKYFLLSYLKRKQIEKVFPTTDEIILDIMPLLKNGITPENQTILDVLNEIAIKVGNDRWKLKSGEPQLKLF